MRRKLNFTSFFSRALQPTTTTKCSTPSNSTTCSSSWAHWPSCNHPRTNSFHHKAEHPVLFDSNESFFTPSSKSMSNDESDWIDDSETIIRGLSGTSRLFFEPGGNSSSILEEATRSSSVDKRSSTIPFKGSTIVMAMESEDPYNDFRKSMEEMVVAHGLMKDWDCLEELLVWYLRVNGKKNHGYIVGAFVDLLVGFGSFSESCERDVVVDSCCDSNSSPISFEIEEVEEEEESGSC